MIRFRRPDPIFHDGGTNYGCADPDENSEQTRPKRDVKIRSPRHLFVSAAAHRRRSEKSSPLSECYMRENEIADETFSFSNRDENAGRGAPALRSRCDHETHQRSTGIETKSHRATPKTHPPRRPRNQSS